MLAFEHVVRMAHALAARWNQMDIQPDMHVIYSRRLVELLLPAGPLGFLRIVVSDGEHLVFFSCEYWAGKAKVSDVLGGAVCEATVLQIAHQVRVAYGTSPKASSRKKDPGVLEREFFERTNNRT